MGQLGGGGFSRVVKTLRHTQQTGIAAFSAVLICPFAPIGGFTLSICCRRGINVGGCIHRLERTAARRSSCSKLFTKTQRRFRRLLRHVAGAYAIHDAFALVGVANDKCAQQRQNDQQDQRNGQHRSRAARSIWRAGRTTFGCFMMGVLLTFRHSACCSIIGANRQQHSGCAALRY